MGIVAAHADVWSALDTTELAPRYRRPIRKRIEALTRPARFSGVTDNKNVGHVSLGDINPEWLCWRGPEAIYRAGTERNTVFFKLAIRMSLLHYF
jgi:hypothetical protein